MSALAELPVEYPHRLALGVEVIDAVTGARLQGQLSVLREPVGDGRAQGPIREFLGDTGGRFKLLHHRSLGELVTLRVVDGQRRYVPRRFAVPVRSATVVAASEADPPGAYIAVASRTLRPWLAAGTAYPCAGATGIQGQVRRGGRPVRWARITAVSGVNVLGRAHGDERGEFLLLMPGPGFARPLPREVPVELIIRAGPSQPTPPSGDPLADLPTEVFPLPAHPPDPADLDNPRLRGDVPPPGYATALPRPVVRVPVGTVVTVPSPISIDP